jgi:hypothetical protein
MALVDQHTVPSDGMENRTSVVLPWDGLSPVRHLGQPKDAHVALLLSSEYPPSTASYLFPAVEETLHASLLAGSLKWPFDVCTCPIKDQKSAWP